MEFIILNPILSISASAGVLILILLIWIIRLEIKTRRLSRGQSGVSLEEAIMSFEKDLSENRNFRKELEVYLTEMEKRMKTAVRAVETIRFDAFKGTGSGGRQSFSTALINEDGDGVILSSLHSRDRVSVFAKPVLGCKSTYELTEEEKHVLTEAQKSCKV